MKRGFWGLTPFSVNVSSCPYVHTLERSKSGRTIRAGKGTMRGRKYRPPKSILLVVAQKGGLDKGARNLPGVAVVTAKDLCAEDLAPGGDIGRLTVWTKSAVEALE